MDFNKILELAKNKTPITNKMTDVYLFTMEDGTRVMQSDMDKYFTRRGRKSLHDKEMFKEYQHYLIGFVEFQISKTPGDLGDVIYNTGEKKPTVAIVNQYRFSEQAISYMNTLDQRSPEGEVAVMIGKALELIPLEPEDDIEKIKKDLKI